MRLVNGGNGVNYDAPNLEEEHIIIPWRVSCRIYIAYIMSSHQVFNDLHCVTSIIYLMTSIISAL